MRRVVLCVVVMLVAGCYREPVSSTKAGRGVTVELLFEHEGVRVYRFYDGDAHYYAVPSSGAAATTFETWQRNCGKNCWTTEWEEMPTLARR